MRAKPVSESVYRELDSLVCGKRVQVRKNRRGSVWVGTTTFAVLVAVFTYGSLTLW
jgi:hypothetical protein